MHTKAIETHPRKAVRLAIQTAGGIEHPRKHLRTTNLLGLTYQFEIMPPRRHSSFPQKIGRKDQSPQSSLHHSPLIIFVSSSQALVRCDDSFIGL
mmetsp:Transcript_48619/g.72573  ORF Transcript_48619/g.72573 Transcript_48619/m.72573 type:complete len:95 (-) Transcript_48619:207-491(-)